MSRTELRARCAAILLALAACSPPMLPSAIEAYRVARVPADVPQGRPRLGVGRFVDARPRADREERRPRLRLHWYGLSRRGEYQTGDTSFLGPISEGVRRDAIATLARSGAFSEVRGFDAGDEDASARAAADDLDLVLVATVEELIGLQYQDSWFGFLLLGGLGARRADPIGLAKIHYRLYDRAGKWVEERIETVHRSSVRTPAQAALDAAARANERIAHQLFSRLVPVEVRARRTLAVRVLDQCDLGRDRVEHLVRETSAVFEREAGVRLRAHWTPRSGPGQPTLEDALAYATDESPPEAGVVLLLTLLSRDRAPDRFGLSVPLGEHAVAACDARGDVRVVTLAHEVGHLFGAVHVESRRSVMHPVAEFDGRFFDAVNRRILRATWNRPFGQPLPGSMREQLDAIYRAALRVSSGVDTDAVRALLASLGDAG